ncbi:MAG: O-antigen ligase family protein [Patescibacteria group bacterium]
MTISLCRRYIFQLLVFFLPTQLALHFWPDWAHIYGFRVDYLSPTIFFTDILVFLLFILWIISKRKIKQRKEFFILLIGFSLVNIYLAKNPEVSLFKWVKITEIIFISFFIATEKSFKLLEWLIKPLMFSLITVSLIAFGQFILQRTIGGPLYLLGERSFTVSTPGISRFSFFGREFLRPYSTFPHPNALGGFMAVCFFLLLCGAKEGLKRKPIFKISLIFTLATLILSVSHAAWISFILASTLLIFRKKKIFKKFYVLLVTLTVIVSLLLPVISVKLLSLFDYPEEISRRLLLSKAAGIMIAGNPLIGVGAGNFILRLTNISGLPKVSWWFQPVHNIFLLTLSETGFMGLGALLFLVVLVMKKVLLQKEKIFLSIPFLIIILTGFADHYWLTLQQTQLLLGILGGLIFKKKV